MNNEFFECECGQHLIAVDSYFDNSGEVSITFWEPVRSQKWGRIRWAWYVLRHGYNDNNGIILSQQDAIKLSDLLVMPKIPWQYRDWSYEIEKGTNNA
jgi:hypothetical protein